MILTVTLA